MSGPLAFDFGPTSERISALAEATGFHCTAYLDADGLRTVAQGYAELLGVDADAVEEWLATGEVTP